MIDIRHKEDCTGCWACVQRCPKQCIAMEEDGEGFLYPRVDTALCVECGLCGRVCPVLHPGAPRQPLSAFAAVNADEAVRLSSSSGGVFTALAADVLRRGGVVFGARFGAGWEVEHGSAETAEGVAAFRGSKYVQSRIGTAFREAEHHLRAGRAVLFSGTPCQTAGLRRYLGRDYDGLLVVDFICHGVPSPGVWRAYLKETVARQCDKNTVFPGLIPGGDARVSGIAFRDKTRGWKKYSFSLALTLPGRQGEQNSVFLREVLNKNAYLRGFLADLYLRPSCHACPAKHLGSGSDVTLADYWGVAGVHPELDDDKGVSVVLCNTERGCAAVTAMEGVRLVETRFDDVARWNPAVLRPKAVPTKRSTFYEAFRKEPLLVLIPKLTRPTFRKRVKSVLRSLAYRIHIAPLLLRLKYLIRNI